MKIDNSIQSVSNTSASGVKKRSGGSSSVNTKSEDANSTVHISAQSTKGSSSGDSVVDVARVQEIKQAISEGAFKVNAEVVADRLLDTAKELIQSKEENS